MLTVFLAFAPAAPAAEVWISEILFNPPGADIPHEYVELRGAPNTILSNGTYLVAVEGDTNGNPGTIQNVFDLSGAQLGGNGFLVVLQNSNLYAWNSNAAVWINTNGAGFGSGNSSTVLHRGEGGQTDLENNSMTVLLVVSTNVPLPGADIDANNDGTPDAAPATGWTVLDAVGVLDNDGLGDVAYGKINFRRNSAATAVTGPVIPVGFNPDYVARTGNTTNWAAGSWLAGAGLDGTAPNWTTDLADTEPLGFANRALNHVGGPNFGAPEVPGVVARESGRSTDLAEGGGTDSYTLNLNTAPGGSVTVQINAGPQLQVSIDGGISFGTARAVVLSNTAPSTNILVRALEDTTVDASPHLSLVTHAITATTSPAQYPLTTPMPQVRARITENDTLLLSELKVNPPGPEDEPAEFIELRGTAHAGLNHVYLLVVEGNHGLNPGVAGVVIDLSGENLGSAGLMLIAADGHPYSVPGGATVFLAPQFETPGGALGNGSLSFLLVSSLTPIVEGTDLDAGDNGVLEGLPPGTTILDSVAWLDGDAGDIAYSPALLTQVSGTPDAATRFPGNTNANTAAAWVNGDLEGTDPATLVYAETGGSTNLSYGTWLTPGGLNNTAPAIAGLTPFSSVIGDPTTPLVALQISDAQTPVGALGLSVSSSDQAVVPDGNLVLGGSGGARTLAIYPTGVGYATITISVSDGTMTGVGHLEFAASEDLRGGGRFHTGVSDASTAMAIDAGYMLVGDDENQVLRVFSRSNSGAALVQFDMNPFLGLEDFYPTGKPREVDIEGSTRVGNRIYWIGSHSHSRDFLIRTNRARIFTTDLAGSGTNISLSYMGRYDYLKIDLLNWDASNGHGKGANYYGLMASGDPGVDPKSPDGSGFNIEGLAMAPGSTNVALVFFRAPLIPTTNRVKALVVPVTNFAALATSSATNPGLAAFGAPMELNLGGRGFRSVEGNSNGYLIVAGPPNVASGIPPNDFRLFTWNGSATNAPQERGAFITNMIPEAIVELPPGPWTSNSMVQLVSDNGITVYYGDGLEAKFHPVPEFKKFRSDWLALGPVVTPRPVIKSFERAGTGAVLSWYAAAGITYRVQWKGALPDAAWNDLPGDVTATDAWAGKFISTSSLTQGFFRVIIP